MKPGFLCIFLLMILAPVSGYGTDYYVNGATGHDSAACGPLADPCKTVKQAVDNTGDGTNVIKIAEGTYVEDSMSINDAGWPGNDNIVTLEGGWNSDFTANSGNRAGTVLRTGTGTLDFVNVRSGASNYGTVGLILRCLSIEDAPAGGITTGIYVGAVNNGKARLSLDNVRMSGFTSSALRVSSNGSKQIDVTVNHSLFDHNPHPDGSLFGMQALGGRINLAIKNSRLVNNGASNVNRNVLSVVSGYSGKIDTHLENTIIAGNTSIHGNGLALYAHEDSRQNATLINTTITENTFSGSGGRSFEGYGSGQAQLTITMTNSIVHNNHSPGVNDLYLIEYGSAKVVYTGKYNIVGEYGEDGSPTHTTFQETDADPKLNGSYHLTSGSPAIDAGICGEGHGFSYIRIAPWDDIDGDKRPGFGKLFGCDIGADEYNPFPWTMFLPAITGNHR